MKVADAVRLVPVYTRIRRDERGARRDAWREGRPRMTMGSPSPELCLVGPLGSAQLGAPLGAARSGG
jgi:hypothetical protein